ncbi:hypothetical protein B0H14DRAFT_3867673 [Mycena olivaceomarginata]|nr:hypothetical protein B0H14DRAFT_3867673 [Mycena olivaceomarginata]
MPTPAILATFDQRWEPGAGASATHPLQLWRAEKDAAKGSNIAKDILEVKDTFLTIIFSRVLVAGLTHWCPDLMGPSDSPYNQVHKTVYLETFRLVAGSFSYYFLAPSAAGVDNPILICDIFCSFTLLYTKHKAKVGLRQPGKLALNKADNNSGKHRKCLTEKRIVFARKDKLPDHVVALIANEFCNSDDESDTDDAGKKIYTVNAKGIRSVSATTFVHQLEVRRLKTDAREKGKKKINVVERTRIRVANPAESDLSFQMPKKVPIDYFTPSEFNDFPAETRFKYAQYGVTLLLVVHHGNTDWKTMDRETYMTKYGNEVLKQYNILTEEVMAQQGNNGWSDDGEPINIPDDLDGERMDEGVAPLTTPDLSPLAPGTVSYSMSFTCSTTPTSRVPLLRYSIASTTLPPHPQERVNAIIPCFRPPPRTAARSPLRPPGFLTAGFFCFPAPACSSARLRFAAHCALRLASRQLRRLASLQPFAPPLRLLRPPTPLCPPVPAALARAPLPRAPRPAPRCPAPCPSLPCAHCAPCFAAAPRSLATPRLTPGLLGPRALASAPASMLRSHPPRVLLRPCAPTLRLRPRERFVLPSLRPRPALRPHPRFAGAPQLAGAPRFARPRARALLNPRLHFGPSLAPSLRPCLRCACTLCFAPAPRALRCPSALRRASPQRPRFACPPAPTQRPHARPPHAPTSCLAPASLHPAHAPVARFAPHPALRLSTHASPAPRFIAALAPRLVLPVPRGSPAPRFGPAPAPRFGPAPTLQHTRASPAPRAFVCTPRSGLPPRFAPAPALRSCPRASSFGPAPAFCSRARVFAPAPARLPTPALRFAPAPTPVPWFTPAPAPHFAQRMPRGTSFACLNVPSIAAAAPQHSLYMYPVLECVVDLRYAAAAASSPAPALIVPGNFGPFHCPRPPRRDENTPHTRPRVQFPLPIYFAVPVAAVLRKNRPRAYETGGLGGAAGVHDPRAHGHACSASLFAPTCRPTPTSEQGGSADGGGRDGGIPGTATCAAAARSRAAVRAAEGGTAGSLGQAALAAAE